MLALILGMVSKPSDSELVRRFKNGDQQAFSEIVTRFQDRVFAQCYRMLGNRNAAEEVAQDVFLACFRALNRFREESALSTWIFRITINHCKNRRLYNRRRHSDAHEPLEGKQAEEGPTRQLPTKGLGTDQGVHRSEAEELLQSALEQLDEGAKNIVLLRDIQGLSYEEIADILGLARGTVKSRLHRARSDLARILTKRISRDDIFD